MNEDEVGAACLRLNMNTLDSANAESARSCVGPQGALNVRVIAFRPMNPLRRARFEKCESVILIYDCANCDLSWNLLVGDLAIS